VKFFTEWISSTNVSGNSIRDLGWGVFFGVAASAMRPHEPLRALRGDAAVRQEMGPDGGNGPPQSPHRVVSATSLLIGIFRFFELNESVRQCVGRARSKCRASYPAKSCPSSNPFPVGKASLAQPGFSLDGTRLRLVA